VANQQHRVSCSVRQLRACYYPAATRNARAREGQAHITDADHGIVAGGGEAIRHSAETSNAPSNGSMIPVMKVRQCWQVNLQLTKPRLSKVALVDRRNSSCSPQFGHFTRRFCKSTFPASAAIAQSPPARCLRHPIRTGRTELSEGAVNLTDAPREQIKKPRRSASTGGAGAS
jgi:hypothetical protein